MPYCPNCKFFGYDCHPEPEDYEAPCDIFEPKEEERGKEELVPA